MPSVSTPHYVGYITVESDGFSNGDYIKVTNRSSVPVIVRWAGYVDRISGNTTVKTKIYIIQSGDMTKVTRANSNGDLVLVCTVSGMLDGTYVGPSVSIPVEIPNMSSTVQYNIYI